MSTIPPSNQPPPPLPPSRRAARTDDEPVHVRLMWGVAGAAGCLGVALLIPMIAAMLAAGTMGGGWLLVRGAVNSIFTGQPPQGTVTSTATIVNQIRPLGQLVSTSGSFAKADISVSIQQGVWASCSHSANHVASATITAGIDLYAIGEEAVSYDPETDTFTIIAPKPVITSCSVDFIDQYQRNLAIPTCSVDWDDARQIAQYEALTEMRDDAIAGGFLETAERQTEIALASFVRALTGSNVVVQFAQDDLSDEELNANCSPQPPRDWAMNPQTGQWVRNR